MPDKAKCTFVAVICMSGGCGVGKLNLKLISI